ncbi:MAG: hypothetical protein B7Z61_11425 [Acidobacteria bacterium 37-71-11]|nr:MAG: hypothetical protein B7Z61_11425 [Acidobacteria bacterium 37-71-11]
MPVSDYLYHALRKLYVMGELNLVSKQAMGAYLEPLQAYMVEFCPEEDKELLRENLAHLGDVRAELAAPVLNLHRSQGGESALAMDDPSGSAKTTVHTERRFAQLVERLARLQIPAGVGSDQGGARGDVLSQLVSVAARNSADSEEFQQYKESMRGAGMASTMEDVFRSLGRRLPGWVLPAAAGSEAAGATVTATAQAMQRIVTLEQDPREAARRFQELVQAAIEQHNQGSLARAVTMLDLAGLLLAEKKVDPAYVQAFREQAHEKLDPQRLRELAEDPGSHFLFRRVLGSFPALEPDGLLRALQTEERRDHRRLLLALLEVHGAPARALAAYQRNLLHILRRIPRPDDVATDTELQTASRLSALGHPAILAKEAITYLGQSRDERAERALIARVTEYEGALTKPGAAGSDPAELVAVLDRAVFALARLGTPAAVRAVVNHGLKRLPQLGNTTARLAALAGVDLASDPEVVERLVEAIRGELPHRIFGFLLKKDDNLLLPLIEAVSSTSSPAVKNVLADIVQRFPGEGFAQAAAKVLAGADVSGPQGPAAPSASSASLSGDLELFGLPTLLQNLSQSGTSGTLTISDPVGEEIATVDLEGGKFRSCRAGPLHDEVALFQLIERPTPASFTFLSRAESAPPSDPKLLRDLVPLFFEGTRRYDEFQQACALIPDYACLRATGTKPTPPPEEDDQALMRTLWQRAGSGAPALECEAGLAIDSYRARRMLAHWVEEGSLEPK